MKTNATARDVMQRTLFTVSRNEPLADLEWELCRRRISGAPVVEAGRLVGMVSRADIARRVGFGHLLTDLFIDYYRELEGRLDPPPETQERKAFGEETLGRHLNGLRVADAMTTDPITVAPETPIADVAKLMREREIHRVVVLQDGMPVGLVATLDLLQLLEKED